jgi:hypothetical protein
VEVGNGLTGDIRDMFSCLVRSIKGDSLVRDTKGNGLQMQDTKGSTLVVRDTKGSGLLVMRDIKNGGLVGDIKEIGLVVIMGI